MQDLKDFRDLDKISILIPVYKESNLLESLLIDLLRDTYLPKEIVVTIDEPTETSLDIVERFRDKIRFILNVERIGKVNALNEAFNCVSGNILLFLDSDIQLQKNGVSFLEILEEEMKGIDILDIKKSITGCSFLEKLVDYEYLGFSLINWFCSNTIRKSLSINGAAFAIRREAFEQLKGFRRTMSEDLDLITRSFVENLSFKYTSKVAVSIRPKSGWKAWYKQRKRWGIATGFWLRDNYKLLWKGVIRKPQVMLPSLLLITPSLFLFFFNCLLSDASYLNIFTLVLSVLFGQPNLVPFTIFLTSFGVLAVKNGIATALAYAVLSFIFYLSAREFGYHFNFAEFFCYYLIYSPLSLLMNIIGVFRVMTHTDMIDLDWKI